MIQFTFKNLDRSSLLEDLASDRIELILQKFPNLQSSDIKVTFEMQNSPFQAGADHFIVRINILRGRYKGIVLKKSSINIYVALADLVDHLLEVLNRSGDKDRVKSRKKNVSYLRQ